jgi:hypothetical protein
VPHRAINAPSLNRNFQLFMRPAHSQIQHENGQGTIARAGASTPTRLLRGCQ